MNYFVESADWTQTSRLKSPFGANYVCKIFELRPHQSMTFNCARFEQNLFGGAAEMVRFKIILTISKVEFLQQNTT